MRRSKAEMIEDLQDEVVIRRARADQVEAALAELFYAIRQEDEKLLEYALMRAGAVVVLYEIHAPEHLRDKEAE